MSSNSRPQIRLAAALVMTAVLAMPVVAQRGRGAGASPASQPPPRPAAPQTYPPDQVKAGAGVFAAQCGFCHGRDAAGGAGGADLTRSELVAQDVRGDRIGPLVRSGRPDRGMPAFGLSDPDLAAIVAFIHDRQASAAAQLGGRRSVDESDLQTGNAEAGRRYFETSCARCHAPTGDLAGVAARLRGLQLLQRMLYPGGRGARPPQATVTLPDGSTVVGPLEYQDEFTVAITDAAGWQRSWPAQRVRVTVDDPLAGHIEQLAKYTDEDMHNVLAFLQTLR